MALKKGKGRRLTATGPPYSTSTDQVFLFMQRHKHTVVPGTQRYFSSTLNTGWGYYGWIDDMHFDGPWEISFDFFSTASGENIILGAHQFSDSFVSLIDGNRIRIRAEGFTVDTPFEVFQQRVFNSVRIRQGGSSGIVDMWINGLRVTTFGFLNGEMTINRIAASISTTFKFNGIIANLYMFVPEQGQIFLAMDENLGETNILLNTAPGVTGDFGDAVALNMNESVLYTLSKYGEVWEAPGHPDMPIAQQF